MKDLILKNIVYSFLEKAGILLFQFLITALMIRSLDRELFGIVAVVGGFFAFTNFINFPLENFLLKESQITGETLKESLNQYFNFSIRKSFVFVLLSVLGSGFIIYTEQSLEYHYAIWSFCFVLALDTMVSPFIMISNVMLKQKLSTKMSWIRWSLSLLLLLPIGYDHSLKWLLIKDLLVLIILIFAWLKIIKTNFNINVSFERLNVTTAWQKFKSFTLWTHLCGSVTNIVYKSDAAILGWFVNLSSVGNYNIALNAGNVANTVPMLLSYQNSVAISHSKSEEQANRLTIRFFRLNLYISITTLIAYLLLGRFYLSLLTGNNNNEEVYSYMINIVIGILLAKTIISPLISYINIKGNVKTLFTRVKLPLLLFSLSTYVISAKIAGAHGLSCANIINAILWCGLMILEVRQYNLSITEIFNFKDDLRDCKHYAQSLLAMSEK